MSSRLHNKINSYSLKKGIEMKNNTFPWPETGSEPTTSLSNWTLTTNGPGYRSDGPPGGEGNQLFTLNTARRYRLNASSNILTGLQSNNYSLGFWWKQNDSTYTNGSTGNVVSVTPIPGGGVNFLLANNAAGLPEQRAMIFQWGDNSGGQQNYIINDPYNSHPSQPAYLAMNKWYYFAVRKNGSTLEYYVNGSLKFSTTISGTTASIIGCGFGSNFSVGSSPTYNNFNISNFYIADYSTIDATAISEIWEAGRGMTTPIKSWNGSTWVTDTDIKRYVTPLGNESGWHDVNAQHWNGSSWVTL